MDPKDTLWEFIKTALRYSIRHPLGALWEIHCFFGRAIVFYIKNPEYGIAMLISLITLAIAFLAPAIRK